MRRNSRGFSLIEVLVAITILTVGILVVSQMVVTGIQINAEEQQRMYARVAMGRMFDFLTGLPYDHAFLIDDGDTTDLNDATSGADFEYTYTDTVANFSYLVRWNIADDMPELNIKTVRVHTLWGPGYKKKLTTDLLKLML
jgi:prepilin-type N-terminal cleavage/methylation domain-containing protein